MFEWEVFFHTLNKGDSLPWLRNIAVACENSVDYFIRGKDRPAHSFSAFQYTISGEGFFRYDGREYRLKAGDGALFKASDPAVEYGFPEDASEPWRFIYTDIWGIDSYMKDLTDSFGPVFKLPQDSAPLKTLFQFECQGISNVSIDYYQGAKIALDLILELGNYASGSVNAANNRIVMAVDKIIAETIEVGVSVCDLAGRLNLSREHLSREFKKQTGVTVQTYINRKRMLFACDMLVNSNLSCKEIAFKLGDPSPSHFSNMFKKYIGVSPKFFRDNYAY